MNDTTQTFNQHRESPESTEDQNKPVVTKAELEALKKTLTTPEATLAYEPTGTAVQQYRAEMEAQKRTRMAQMESRLNRLHHKARDDFNLTQAHLDLKDIDRER